MIKDIWHDGRMYPSINDFIIVIYKDKSIGVLKFSESPAWDMSKDTNILKYTYLKDLLAVEKEHARLESALSDFFPQSTSDDFEPWFRPFSAE